MSMLIEKMHGLLDTSMIDTLFIWPPLTRAGYGQSEDELLRAIEENVSKQIVYYAVIGLWEYGSSKSLPVLKQLVHYPKQDVQTTSVVTIGKIAGETETEFYGELLEDPKYKDKMYPMTILWEVGSAAALPAVMRFADRVINHKIGAFADTIDPRYIRDYLGRHKDRDEVDAIIEKLNQIIAGMSFVKGYEG